MKIAFIGGRDIRLIGGIESYMFNLATQLAAKGHEPIVYCESDHNGEEVVNGFRVKYRKSVGGRYLCKIILGLGSTLDALFNEKGVGYFHYNAWPPSLWSWIPRMFGRKALMQGHGFEWKRTKYSPAQQRVMHFMEWLTAKMHRNIIVVSDEQREYFGRSYGRRCTTIPSAVNIPSAVPQSDILSRYGLGKDGYFLFLGRLVQDKNPDYLIRAYIKSGIKGKRLVIAGSNDQLPDYVEHLHSLGAGCKDVVFTGAVYGADKEALLANCFAFCIPSTIEGLAITLLEAMSYGCVCIASDIPSNREGLGDNGVWVKVEDEDDLAQKMRYVEENPQEAEMQREANIQRVRENFTWEKISARYAEYLESI